MDVQIKFRIEESVIRMGLYRRGGHVNMKDAQTNLRKEEFVLNMGLLRRERLALMTDAPTKAGGEGYVQDITSYRMGGCNWLYYLLTNVISQNEIY